MNRLSMFLLAAFSVNSVFAQASLDELAIEVRDNSRGFAYTDKQDAFFYGETNNENTTSWQGFNVFGHEFLDDYRILVDGRVLDRQQAITTVYPDYLRRLYPNGIVEELRLADTIPLFSVVIKSNEKQVAVEIIPLVTDGARLQDFIIGHTEHALVFARTAHPKRTSKENYPVWLAVGGKNFDANLNARRVDERFAPFSLKLRKASICTIAFAVADDALLADSLIQTYLAHQELYIDQRRHRMEQLLNDSWVETENQRFNKALAWAKLSLDALVMNQVTKGIFAGLPWFNNYWGRDTFISLPGATLVTGRFSEAKEILRSFARYQQIDTTSTDYGRIPNIVTTTNKAYNTADGTARFVIMAREYVVRSGDSAFIKEIYPVIRRATEGTLKYHCDSLGFLTHGEAETWMDAVGPDGPWSPRGNRANDIQELWAKQLTSAAWFAQERADHLTRTRWMESSSKLNANFRRHFVSPDQSRVYDHLNPDGTADTQIRPNQIFVETLVDDSLQTRIVHEVINNLTYPHGVASLNQDDENFHPYHQYEPYYSKDAAYHNGTVWTWLQGQLISQLCRLGRQEVAAQLTDNTVLQILDRGAVGTQSELLDAVPHPGEKEPRLSGTFSQAWNLAEFIRNFYEDYLGVEVSKYYHGLALHPAIPRSLGKVTARIDLEGRAFEVVIKQHAPVKTIDVKSPTLRQSGKCVVLMPTRTGQTASISFELQSNSRINVAMHDTTISVRNNDTAFPFAVSFQNCKRFDQLLGDLAFVKPSIKPGLKAMRGPDYPLIPTQRIKATNPKAKILVDVADSVGDDVGLYSYPLNPYFRPGIFDIVKFSVSADDSNAYFTLKFKALSNPGWHPEYGFQLTYVAIAVDEDGMPGSGARIVPRNAGYMLDARHAFEKLILVGGGLRLEDKNGKILVAYIPAESDVSNPLGNTEAATISFALPLSFLGTPGNSWTFTVLAGGQDDHGGSGLGEFRTVNKEVGEWNGGGKMKPDDPNVYDVLVAPVRQ